MRWVVGFWEIECREGADAEGRKMGVDGKLMGRKGRESKKMTFWQMQRLSRKEKKRNGACQRDVPNFICSKGDVEKQKSETCRLEKILLEHIGSKIEDVEKASNCGGIGAFER